MLKVLTVSDVINIFSDAKEVDNENVDINSAIGRVLSEDIITNENLPGFKRSSVDGYALISSDTYLCSESMPAMLRYTGSISIGEKPTHQIRQGECVYIPTGAMLPDGADAVAMIENCEELGDEILINKPASKWENVVFEDDDVKVGEIVIKKGTVIEDRHIAILAGLGITKVLVKRKIKAAIISTGDELISPYDNREIPKVRDINGYYLTAALIQDGCDAKYIGIAKDNEDELFNLVKNSLEESDVVFISGGSSAGNRDFTINIMERLGEVLFHGIAIKPGKPTLMARVGEKFIVGLPGHPLSCAVVYRFIMAKLIDKMLGRVKKDNSLVLNMGENYHKAKGREEYLPVRIEGDLAYPIYAKSSAISVMARCDGFIKIDRDLEGIQSGEKVVVLR